MSPVEEGIVRGKLAVIVENLKALEPIKDLTREEYIEDLYKRKATERLLQELIEAAIDINTHIKVGELNIISADLAEKLAPSAGLGNRLVHEYDMLKHSLVLDAVRMAEDLYTIYIKEIEDYISKSS